MYAVSSGSYSDYRVKCLCETEAAANAVAAKLRTERDGFDTDAVVEQFDVVDESVESYPQLRIDMEIYDDGRIERPREWVNQKWPFDEEPISARWRWVRAPCHNGCGGRLEVWGADHARVRKVFTEKRALFMADKVMAKQKEIQGGARK